MKTKPLKPPVKNSQRPRDAEPDSTSGEGSASALASLRRLERNREKSKPANDQRTDE